MKSAKRQKMYRLPPNLKHAGNALAHGSLRALAKECLSDKKVRNYILLSIGRDIRSEIKSLSTRQSVLCSQLPNDLRQFHWDMIYNELEQKAPVFCAF